MLDTGDFLLIPQEPHTVKSGDMATPDYSLYQKAGALGR